MSTAWQSTGTSRRAAFTLRLHRGDGMVLLAMNWKAGRPPEDFVGFAIEYCEPGGDRFFAVRNRLAFPGKDGKTQKQALSSKLSPIQMFRWIHFPRNARLQGKFVYRVTPMFMDRHQDLSEGPAQEASLELRRETLAGRLNVAFTRGFVSSQAFVDRFGGNQAVKQLLPGKADRGLEFVPTHEQTEQALTWMGFEAREVLLSVLDEAVRDKTAEVFAVVYDLNDPEIVERYERLGNRLKIVIDDDGAHAGADSAESKAADRLRHSAGDGNVVRHHMGTLQHNKMVVVDGKSPVCLCGSTNHSWRGLYVQNNHLVELRGKQPVRIFRAAAERYFNNPEGKVKDFSATDSAEWNDLGLKDVDAQVTFSPHSAGNSVLGGIAEDIAANAESSVLFSLAFLYQTPGKIRDAIAGLRNRPGIFCCGISDHEPKTLSKHPPGVAVQTPDGLVEVVGTAVLSKHVPEPFRSEPAGGGGTRMHHKFIVIDFNKPTARVYLGSYNFSIAADTKNGENLLLVRDQTVATSFAVESLRIFDHYQFRLRQENAKTAKKALQLRLPPDLSGDKPWWTSWYEEELKIRDRELFA